MKIIQLLINISSYTHIHTHLIGRRFLTVCRTVNPFRNREKIRETARTTKDIHSIQTYLYICDALNSIVPIKNFFVFIYKLIVLFNLILMPEPAFSNYLATAYVCRPYFRHQMLVVTVTHGIFPTPLA